MKRTAIVIALAASFAAPLYAADEMMESPTCADFTSMESGDQMKSMQMLSSDPTINMGSDKMSESEMTTRAMEACEANPDATVTEALLGMQAK